MNLDDIRAALRAAKLDRLAADAERLTLPAIHIEPRKARENSIPIGASKIGGRPDLPSGMLWPTREGKPLGFLAQFNLAEVASFDHQHILPTEGVLSFFYDFAGAPWGLKPEDRGGWQVLYFGSTDATSLSRAGWPTSLPTLHRLPAQRPTFSSVTSLASEPEWVANLTLTDHELLQVSGVAEELIGPAEDSDEGEDDDPYVMLATAHQLLGYPILARAGTPLECQLVSAGQPNIAAEVITNARKHGDDQARQQLVDAFKQWRLLVQLGNISGLPFPEGGEDDDDPVWRLSELCDLWARGGLMHFWIETDRLARRDFSNVWLLADSQL